MIINKIKKIIRYMTINRNKIKKLKNRNFSVISSNCNGALILHELKERFNSPTVNLYFEASDYIKFLEKFDFYIKKELEEIVDNKYTYPVGKLDDIKIYFMHYKSFEEAKKKWEERLLRINKENLFIMMTDRDGCNKEIIERFDKLPYKNKVIFTNVKYENITSAFYINGFEDKDQVGELSRYKSKFSIYKHYDKFNYVEWFNSKHNK